MEPSNIVLLVHQCQLMHFWHQVSFFQKIKYLLLHQRQSRYTLYLHLPISADLLRFHGQQLPRISLKSHKMQYHLKLYLQTSFWYSVSRETIPTSHHPKIFALPCQVKHWSSYQRLHGFNDCGSHNLLKFSSTNNYLINLHRGCSLY